MLSQPVCASHARRACAACFPLLMCFLMTPPFPGKLPPLCPLRNAHAIRFVGEVFWLCRSGLPCGGPSF